MTKSQVNPGVGMPHWLKLDAFGRIVMEAFPEALGCYHVGSSLKSKKWRDVDVRLMLTDEDFEKLIGPHTSPKCLNPRWNALCLAFTALAVEATGLNVDFQIDQMSEANRLYPLEGGYLRSSLGLGML